MSVVIVDDEQRRDRPATRTRPSGSGGAGAPAALALLDVVHRHRLRRAALHLPSRRSEHDPSQFSDRLLADARRTTGRSIAHTCQADSWGTG